MMPEVPCTHSAIYMLVAINSYIKLAAVIIPISQIQRVRLRGDVYLKSQSGRART
jgi:hypothetical protein